MTCKKNEMEVFLKLTDAFFLFLGLDSMELLTEKPLLWWPSYGNFEVVVGAILTQNSQWTSGVRGQVIPIPTSPSLS